MSGFLTLLLSALGDFLNKLLGELRSEDRLKELGYDTKALEDARASQDDLARYAALLAQRARSPSDLARRLRALSAKPAGG